MGGRGVGGWICKVGEFQKSQFVMSGVGLGFSGEQSGANSNASYAAALGHLAR